MPTRRPTLSTVTTETHGAPNGNPPEAVNSWLRLWWQPKQT